MVSLSNPTIATTGNLRWTRNGVVYAEWLLSARPGGYESIQDKEHVVNEHRHLFTDLTTALLTSVVAPIDIAVIANKIIQPHYLDHHPDYVIEASAQLNDIELQDPPPRERIMWLSVPLCGPAHTGAIAEDFQPSDKDRAHFDALADIAFRKIPAAFTPTPVTAAQMHWLWTHAHVRGVAPTPFPHRSREDTAVRAVRGFRPDGELDEALRAEGIPRRSLTRAVKATLTDTDIPPSYQAFLVIDSFPARLAWPGVGDQIFAVLSHFEGLGIDYTIRTRIRDRAEALAANARSLRQLSEQMDERADEVSFAQNFLITRGGHLSQYNTHLEANPSETEIHFCPIIAVSATSHAELADRVRDVTRTFNDIGVHLVAPYGAQSELWATSQPGYPDMRASTDYTHFTATDLFPRFMPVTAAGIGDDAGPIIARNRLTGFNDPVHFDLLGITERDRSASFAALGELGAGKSVLLKVLLGQVVDLGGQGYLVDRTDMAEYEKFAKSVADAVVIDIANPSHTLDPLRVFTGPDAAERTLTVLMPLFGIRAGSPEAVLLSDLLDPNYRARHKITCLADLAAHLTQLSVAPARAAGVVAAAGAPTLTTLTGQLRFWAQRSYARALFSTDLPPVPLQAPMVVLRTHRLQLPAEGEDPRDQPTKLFGETIYALFATIARQALFTTTARFGLLLLDEALHLTRSTVGQTIISDFAVDGRKHNAAIGLASQDPAHFGRSARLIPTLFLFRQTDHQLAADELALAGVDTTRDAHLVTQLMKAASGECFMRDLKSRLAPVKIQLPARADRARAVLTTPGRQVA